MDVNDNQATNGSNQVTSRTIRIIFLLGDTVLPDTVSLLLIRSGDIETNPGPDSCKDCGRNFTPKIVPVICTECQGRFCKTTRGAQKTTYIGLTRWKQERALEANRLITCRLCKGEPPRRAHPFNEGVTPHRIDVQCHHAKRRWKSGKEMTSCYAQSASNNSTFPKGSAVDCIEKKPNLLTDQSGNAYSVKHRKRRKREERLRQTHQ